MQSEVIGGSPANIVSRDVAPGSRAAPATDELVAEVRGVNVHAKQLVDGCERPERELATANRGSETWCTPTRPPIDIAICSAETSIPSRTTEILLLLTGPTSDDDGDKAPPRRRWAWLLRHVSTEDVDTCVHCGGPMRWLEAATTPDAISRLLADHGLAPRAPPHRSVPPPGQLSLPFAG